MSNTRSENGGRGKAQVHALSLKRGASHGLWQYKIVGTHERVIVNGLRNILDKTCQALGESGSDRSVVYLLHFSAEPFEGCQVGLERVRETTDGDCYYRVRASTIGEFTARGRFPAIVRRSYLGAWPEMIYFRLEKSMTGGIVS
jgi:hypothetical protein